MDFVFWEDKRCLSRPSTGRVGHPDLTQNIAAYDWLQDQNREAVAA
jgi:hypothetical protein